MSPEFGRAVAVAELAVGVHVEPDVNSVLVQALDPVIDAVDAVAVEHPRVLEMLVDDGRDRPSPSCRGDAGGRG